MARISAVDTNDRERLKIMWDPTLSTGPDAAATESDATGPEDDAGQAGQANSAAPGEGRRVDTNEIDLSQANIAQMSTNMKNAPTPTARKVSPRITSEPDDCPGVQPR